MIEFFLFPNSTYLRERWWHRLATVALWSWLPGLVFLALGKLGDLASSWPVDANAPLPDVIGFGVVATSVLYVLAILASLLYRIVLYVAKGSAWRDPPSVT
jgi:hypothetical protein